MGLVRDMHGYKDYSTQKGSGLEQLSLLHLRCGEKGQENLRDFQWASERSHAGTALSLYGDLKVAEGQVSQNVLAHHLYLVFPRLFREGC